MNIELVLTIGFFVFTQVITAGGVYAAIRADLREHKIRISMLEKQSENRKCPA